MLQDINVEHTIKELMGTIKINQSLQLCGKFGHLTRTYDEFEYKVTQENPFFEIRKMESNCS
jgi:hypothetical protein